MVHRFWNDRPVTHLCELASLIYACVLFSTSFPQMPNRFLPVLSVTARKAGSRNPSRNSQEHQRGCYLTLPDRLLNVSFEILLQIFLYRPFVNFFS